MPSVDLYALAHDRSLQLAERFLMMWTKDFAETRSQYEYPQYANDPDHIFFSAKELIAQLCVHRDQEYAIYWDNPQAASGTAYQVINAMMFFNSDGTLVVGITVATDSKAAQASFLQKLAQPVEAEFAYSVHEAPPAGKAGMFRTFAQTHAPPRIVDGKLVT
jgi:hypothetical protein